MTATILITGATRGLGRALVAAYLLKPDITVIATVRDIAHPNAISLATFPIHTTSRLITIPLSSTDSSSALSAISILTSKYGIKILDTVIANAGMSTGYPTVAALKVSDLQTCIETNVFGPIWLFQATLSLLEKSKNGKFVVMSSAAGSIGEMEKILVPNAAYGASKALLNWLVRKIYFEHPGLIALPVHPGWAQTDTGNTAALVFGMDKAAITIEESVKGVVNVIEGATREKSSGRFLNYDGTEFQF